MSRTARRGAGHWAGLLLGGCLCGLLVASAVNAASATQAVTVCFNYGCLTEAEVVYDAAQLDAVRATLGGATDAAAERAALALVVGRLLGWAGEQSPIGADKGGNLPDDAVYGKMDCIDHSTTTTRLLRMLDGLGMLRFHAVLDPALRRRMLIFDHYSALIRETAPAEGAAADYVVDSWFFDNGRPAAVMPLAQWQAGDDPNDDE